MKKLVIALSKRLLLLSIVIGASALMASTAFAANKVIDFGTITSQTFAKNQGATAFAPTIIVTDDGTTPTITEANDIRLVIPAGATNVVWDATDTSIIINDTGADAKIQQTAGGAACSGTGECTVTVTYADSNKTMIIPVAPGGFAAADSIQIKTLTTTMTTFTAEFDDIGLELSTNGDGTAEADCGAGGATACNTQTLAAGENIDVGAVIIASAAAQKFATNQAAVAISAITLTEDAASPVLNSTDDIRITIPSGSNFIWDTADTTLTLTDGAGTPLADTGKVTSCAASPCTVTLTGANFEDSGRTLFIPLAGAFAAGDAFVITGINYKTFSARSAGTDNLDLDVAPGSTVVSTDTAAISVSTPTISSSAAQQFTSGMNTQPLDWTITMTEDASVAIIGAANDFVIKIPSAFNMNFDPADTGGITVGGIAATVAKVAQSQGGAVCASATTCTVTPLYFQADGTSACTAAAGNCRAMRVPIDAATLAAGDILTVTGASLFNFSSASTADNLELEVVAAASYGTAAVDEDNQTITVVVGSSTKGKDKTPTAAPTNFKVSDEAVLTWTDPTATDLKEIEILKGIGSDPVNGTPIAIVAKGVKTYTDSSAVAGQTLKYIIRAKDTSNNISANSETVTITVATPPEPAAAEPINVTLIEQNTSGQSGTATIEEVTGGLKVTLALTGNPANTQPAHIHSGSCAELGDAKYTLTSVSSGASETTLDLTMDELKAGYPLAVNVHKSTEEAGTYYTCGNIGAETALEEVDLAGTIAVEVTVAETGIVAEEVTLQDATSGASLTIEAATAATVTADDGTSVAYTGTIASPKVAEEQTVVAPQGTEPATEVFDVDTGVTTSVTFDTPVTLVLPAKGEVDLEKVYTLYTVDETTGELSQPVECTVKTSGEDKVFECAVTHLTKFVVLASEPEEEEVVAEEEEEMPFVDVNNHWSKDYVTDLYNQGIVSGKDLTHFKPEDSITRAEFTKVIVGAFGIEVKDAEDISTMPFKDVKAGDWFLPYAEAAKEEGLVGGYADGTFKPNATITRAEAMKILLEAAGADTEGAEKSTFKDVSQSAWYAKYVNYAAENDIVKGYADGTFGPDKNITRAETAKIVSLMMAE